MAKAWRFGKKATSGTTVSHVMPLSTASQSENAFLLYRNLTELPLKNYIDGVVNGNLSAIVKSGVCGDQSELLSAWGDINQQYAEAIGDGEQRLYLSLYKEINRLSLTIEQVAILVKALNTCYVKLFADTLNSVLHASFKFDVTNKLTYEKDLQRCINLSKGFQIQMDLKLSQFKAIQEKQQTPGQAATHEYFQSVLITLEDHAKIPLNDSMPVYQFCERIKRLNKALEEAKK